MVHGKDDLLGGNEGTGRTPRIITLYTIVIFYDMLLFGKRGYKLSYEVKLNNNSIKKRDKNPAFLKLLFEEKSFKLLYVYHHWLQQT